MFSFFLTLPSVLFTKPCLSCLAMPEFIFFFFLTLVRQRYCFSLSQLLKHFFLEIICIQLLGLSKIHILRNCVKRLIQKANLSFEQVDGKILL